VDTGSREENASNKELELPFRFPRNGNGCSVPMLTNDSQIGSDLRVWADEDDRTDFDQQR
jgi:hypothetical protein